MRKAFTLIEVLVVVLIIGILSAVALPQYKIAVLKSKYTTLLTNTRAVMDALEVYYLANGTYPKSLSDAAISIPGCSSDGGNLTCPDIYYGYFTDFNFNEFNVQSMFHNFVGLGYKELTPHGNDVRTHDARKRYCIADSGNTAANQVCKSLGGIPAGTSSFYADPSYRFTYNDWNKYELL